MQIIGDLLQLYVLVLVARAILSWFPLRPDSALIPVVRAMDSLINPVLDPLRRIIPPAGMFDLSFLVLIIIVEVLAGIFHGSLGIL